MAEYDTYPNPLAGTLHLRWEAAKPSVGPLTATLHDALGRQCLHAAWPLPGQPLALSLPALAPGLATGLRLRQKLVQP